MLKVVAGRRFPAGKSFRRRYATDRPAKSRGGRLLALTVGTVGAATAGGLAYSYLDPKFRSNVEITIPLTKPLYKAVLGEPRAVGSFLPANPFPVLGGGGSDSKKILPKAEPAPVKKEAAPAKEKIEKAEVLQSQAVAEKKVVVAPIATRETKPIDVPATKKKPEANPYKGADKETKNKSLDDALKQAIANAEGNVRKATTAKLETIRSIEHHIQTIREAVEAGPAGDWDAVIVAHADAEKKTLQDMQAEKIGRKTIDELEKVINLGAQGETTTLNPLLAVSRETALKLKTELDEMVSLIKKVDVERVFKRDYGKLVEEGRKRFAKELRAVLPSADWTKNMDSFNKAQLNTLLVHAHLRVDQMRRQLIEMKLSEEERIKQSVSELKESELKNAALNMERNANNAEELALIKENFDAELKKRMEELEANYNKQLNEVVRTQKQLYDIEHAKDVENAVQSERVTHSSVINRALAQLDGLETALKSRVVQDAENRRAKQMWLGVQNLVESIEFGKKGSCCMEGRRMPLDRQMKTLLQCAGEDAFLTSVASAMDKTTKIRGEYTREDLKTRFDKVTRIGGRVANLDANGGGIGAHLLSWLKSILTFRLGQKYSEKEKIDPAAMSNQQLLERARYFMAKGDLLQAVKLLQCTKGPTRSVANDLIVDARRHEEALLLARLMLAHAAVTSIRSTY